MRAVIHLPTRPLRAALLRGTPRRAAFLPLLVVFLSCGSSPSDPGPSGSVTGDLAVLFVGNSLTYWNDMPDLLKNMLQLADVGSVQVEMVAFGNFGLEDHWVEGTALARIAQGGWDVVALQQGPSATEGRPSLLDYSERFAERIRAAGATPALYMVWPANVRFFDFEGVSDSYRTAAQNTGGLLFPAGEAWRSAWDRDADLQLYGGDGFHPSLLGSYLAGLVMFEQLANRDPHTLPNQIVSSNGTLDLDPALATLLKDAAVEANARHALTAARASVVP